MKLPLPLLLSLPSLALSPTLCLGLSLGLCLSLAPHTATAATALVLQDTDIYKYQGVPTTSTGDLDITSEFAGDHVMRSFLKFDIASLGYQPGDTVTSAYLWLYASSVASTGTIQVMNLTGDWTVPDATWLTQPGVGSFLTGTPVTTADTWYAFDVTSLVQGWVNDPTSNYGLRLSSPSTAQVKFISNDAAPAYADYKPYLAVTPEPGRAALLLLGLGASVGRRVRRPAARARS